MSVELIGLDGSNPMGLLAALGTLAAGAPGWRLGWREDGTWSAYLDGPKDQAAVLDVLLADHARWGEDSLLTCVEDDDIKLPPARIRALAEELLGTEAAAWLGVLVNEIALDRQGKNVKPSALYFTSGTQRFLSIVREIHAWSPPSRDPRAQLEAALFHPWRREDPVKSLRWDATMSRDYALRLKDPSNDKSFTEAGGEWLAFRGLRLLPSAPRHGKLYTASVGGSWKRGWFRWPLWSPAASLAEVSALLTRRDVARLSPAARRARGIFAVFTAAIKRAEQGGRGTFAPARLAKSADDPG